MRDSRLFDSVVGSAAEFDIDEPSLSAATPVEGDPWESEAAEEAAGRPRVGKEDPRIGTSVGHIRLEALAGQGGMGTVYEGWDEKLRRRVAVKAVSRHYRADADARARFLREARLLSKIQHPNICQIHEHIEGPDGDYLVLELIRGRSLRQILEQDGKLEPAEGLRVARQLVDALVAAHDRGVAHRDLKPGNVMITEDGTVKVLDFGLALSVERAVEKGTARTGLSWTESGAVKRPTKADLANQEDPPSALQFASNDTVVSVAGGSGSSAIEGTLGYMSPEQARSEPAGAASDIYSLGLLLQEMFTGASAYPSGLPLTYQLVKVGRGETLPATGIDPDLAPWIERMKSLAPGSRPSAPDIAERLSWIAKKPARRARRIAVSAFILLLAVFAGVMAFQRVRIAQEAARANREAEAARQVSDFLVDLFEVSDPWNTEASGITARELLERGAQRIRGELEDQPQTRARLLGTIGEIYRRLGFYSEARPMLEEALELRRRDDALPSDLATGLSQLAQLDSDQGEYDQALERFEAAVELRRRVLSPDHPDLATSVHLLGFLQHRRGNYDLAITSYEEALGMRDRAFGPRSEPVAEVLSDMALSYAELGRFGPAEDLHLRALDIRKEILPKDHPSLGVSYANLAAHYFQRGQYGRAVPLFERDLEIATAALGPDHPDVAISHNNLGSTLRELGRLQEAEPHAIRSLEIRRRVLGEEHASVGVGLHGLASLYFEMGRIAEAESLFEHSLSIWRAAYGDQHPYVAASLANRGDLYAATGRLAEALPLLERAVAIREDHYGSDHLTTVSGRIELSRVLLASGSSEFLDEAETQLNLAASAVAAQLQEDPEHQAARYEQARSLQGLAAVARRRGKAQDAEELLARAYSVLAPLAEDTESVRHDIGLVRLLLDMARDGEAKPLARDLLRRGIGRPDFVSACKARGWIG